MRRNLYLALMASLLLASGLASESQAQTRGRRSVYRVQCDSQNYRYQHCDVPGVYRGSRAYVEDVILRQQLSTGRGVCQKNSSFGLDQDGIWADRGCRGIFDVYVMDNGYYPPPARNVDQFPYIDGQWTAVTGFGNARYDVQIIFQCDGNHTYTQQLRFDNSNGRGTTQLVGEYGDACGHAIQAQGANGTLYIRNAINYRIQVHVIGSPRR